MRVKAGGRNRHYQIPERAANSVAQCRDTSERPFHCVQVTEALSRKELREDAGKNREQLRGQSL